MTLVDSCLSRVERRRYGVGGELTRLGLAQGSEGPLCLSSDRGRTACKPRAKREAILVSDKYQRSSRPMSSGQKEARRVRARPAQLGFDGVELTCSTKQAGLTSDKVGYLNQSSERPIKQSAQNFRSQDLRRVLARVRQSSTKFRFGGGGPLCELSNTVCKRSSLGKTGQQL